MMFSQYNIQIYCSTIACLLSIIIAIIPSQVILTRKTKVVFILAPFIINIITAIIIIIDVYFSGQWTNKGPGSFWSITDVVPFLKRLLITSGISTILMGFIINFLKKTTYNDKKLMRYYIKLTENQNPSGHIIIIGGSMDFLGIRPCSNITGSHFTCEKVFKQKTLLTKKIEHIFAEKKCRKCCLNNEQWRQLTNLISTGCRVQIVCTHPDNTETEIITKELLGFILKAWKKNNIDIRFFTADNDPHIRGRIIEDFSKVKHICWNFKTNNGKQNSYEAPYTYSENERMGAFVIKAFNEIQATGKPISDEEKTAFINAFDNRGKK